MVQAQTIGTSYCQARNSPPNEGPFCSKRIALSFNNKVIFFGGWGGDWGAISLFKHAYVSSIFNYMLDVHIELVIENKGEE